MNKVSDENDITSTIVNSLQNEHNEIFARTRSIDTRASILISILLAILPFYFEILDWSIIQSSLISSCVSFKEVCLLISFFLSLLAFVVSLILGVLVICSKIYHTFPSDNYLDFDINAYREINASINEINVSLIWSFTQCINKNIKTVNKKSKMFVVTIITTIFFVFFVIFTTLCNLL